MTDKPKTGAAWQPDCLCWCQVRPAFCTLRCCGCIVHDHEMQQVRDLPTHLSTQSD